MQERRRVKLQHFLASVGVEMEQLDLLDMALTHTSYAHESKKHPRPQHNERIEFLGDSVLSIIVSTYMYRNFPKLPEGKLTKLRAYIVCEASLYEYAKKIHLGDFLLLGHGEEMNGGRERPSILADAFEAVLGAIYLDQGMEVAQRYLLGLMSAEIDMICTHGVYNDYKTRLQEFLQRDGDVNLEYEVIGSTGPAHNMTFMTNVMLDGSVLGTGTGRTKKDAEQHAAQQALEKLRTEQ